MHDTNIINELDDYFTGDSLKTVKVIPLWRSKGTYPRDIFPDLLEILHYYFEVASSKGCPKIVGDDPKFDAHRTQFLRTLNAAYLDDIHYFFAQDMVVNQNKIYMGALLRKILHYDLHNIQDEMLALAQYLSRYDPSYIVDSPALNVIYADDCVGPGFSFSHFKEMCLPLLCKQAKPDMTCMLDAFSENIKHDTTFTTKMLEELRSIYVARWNLVQGTSLDYTRQKSPGKHHEANRPWVFVAQSLKGAKLFPSGYYQYLMPSIEFDKVFVSQELLEHYPLFHYILSEKGDRLLSLDISVDYFDNPQSGLLFCNRDAWPLRPFTAKELARIQYSDKRFSGHLDLFKKNLELPVRRSTVNIVYDLVMASLRKSVSNTELVLDYLTFSEKLGSIDTEERDRFYSQRIVWNGRDYSIYDVLSQIELGDVKEGCTSILGTYLVKFVIDYRPEVVLTAHIEQDIRVQLMRNQSAGKVYSDKDTDMMKRNERLMVSLLTIPFTSRLFFGTKLSFWGCSNNCDTTLDGFFCQLKAIIETKSNTDAYTELMSQMVLPNLLTGEPSKLPDDVLSWLKCVREDVYFPKENLYFDAKALFCVLCEFKFSIDLERGVKKCLDDWINTFININNESVLNVCINVKFKQFLAVLPEKEQASLLTTLRVRSASIQDQDFIKLFDGRVRNQQREVSSTYFDYAIRLFSPPPPPRRDHDLEISKENLSDLNTVCDVERIVREGRASLNKQSHRLTEPLRHII